MLIVQNINRFQNSFKIYQYIYTGLALSLGLKSDIFWLMVSWMFSNQKSGDDHPDPQQNGTKNDMTCRGGSSTKMFLRSTSSSCWLLMLNGFIEWIQLYDELFELMVYEETYKYVSLPTVLPHILPHAFTGGVFECVLPTRIGTMEEHSYLGSHQLKFRVYDRDPANYESAYLDPPSTHLNV